ncbi:MAG TPA: hypothetical protein V6D11_01770 [Waterburya sp.]|jgi:hypothetical protein
MHLFASAIDTALPKPPEHTHIMLDFAASWVEVPDKSSDLLQAATLRYRYYPRYPDESLADWHNRLALTQE